MLKVKVKQMEDINGRTFASTTISIKKVTIGEILAGITAMAERLKDGAGWDNEKIVEEIKNSLEGRNMSTNE